MPDDRAADRASEHAGIGNLIEGLVPALVAKLGTLNVGELEVREGDWKIRLRRPADALPPFGRRATDRPGQRTHPGHESLGAPAPAVRPAAVSGAASGATGVGSDDAGSTNGSTGPALAAVGPGRQADAPGVPPGQAATRGPIATSPAVGIFQPGPKAVGGTRVRAGERLGSVDMLGIPHDVVAPVDGIVIGVLAETGTAVEYGQELIHVEAAGPVEAR